MSEADVDTETPAFVDAEGKFQEGWQGRLDEDIRGEKSLESFGSVQDLAKSYVQTKKMVGADKVVIPGEKATDEEWNTFYAAKGRPGSPDDYKFEAPEGADKDFFDESVIAKARPIFHKIGLNQADVALLVAFDAERAEAARKANQEGAAARMQEAGDALRKDWGANYDQNVHLGNVAVEMGTGGNAELKARIVERFGPDPDFARFAAALGAKFDEHKIVHDSQAARETASQIDEKIREARKDPAYMNRKDPGHKRQVELVTELHKKKAAASSRTSP